MGMPTAISAICTDARRNWRAEMTLPNGSAAAYAARRFVSHFWPLLVRDPIEDRLGTKIEASTASIGTSSVLGGARIYTGSSFGKQGCHRGGQGYPRKTRRAKGWRQDLRSGLRLRFAADRGGETGRKQEFCALRPGGQFGNALARAHEHVPAWA